ncbi:MAG: thiazole synthase [Candidatus Dadabacteria bacterium]|nr:MAG: thiazole synthase [Candidatus Dadabacteria bacterium]
MDTLQIGSYKFNSRLFLGTGKFSSNTLMREAIEASGSELVTVALKRVKPGEDNDQLLNHLKIERVRIIPNTSGARTAEEALFAARLAREAIRTDLVKLEIHPDPRYLLPDPFETLKAAELLVKDDFTVLPYTGADPVLCKKLEEVGVAAVMPLGAPIGSNQGLKTRSMLEIIIEESRVPVVIDAGLGLPSHAADALEIGADAVLVNTAIATAGDPVLMARAFKEAVSAGRRAYLAGRAAIRSAADASSPLTSFLDSSVVNGR